MRSFLLIVFFGCHAFCSSAQLSLVFSNLEKVPSTFYLAIYMPSDKFMSDDFYYGESIQVNSDSLLWQIDSLPAGTYALTAYQDVNNNGKLDRGMFGMPKEPFGFSNNPPVAMKGPSFHDCSFIYDGFKLKLDVRMK